MRGKVYKVTAVWDDEASVWVATSEDVPGLVAEAPTQEAMIEELKVLIPELLRLNTPQKKAAAKKREQIKFRLSSEVEAVAVAC
jgi:predicted RNase H-like HicB family nuclease